MGQKDKHKIFLKSCTFDLQLAFDSLVLLLIELWNLTILEGTVEIECTHKHCNSSLTAAQCPPSPDIIILGA
jgi:hypothetical protein